MFGGKKQTPQSPSTILQSTKPSRWQQPPRVIRNTTTINLTKAGRKDLLSRATHPPRSKGHSKSILTEAVEMHASVNQIKKHSISAKIADSVIAHS